MGKQNDIKLNLNDNCNVYTNTNQDIVVTTKDKLELVLLKAESTLSQKRAWLTPLGLLITCVITLLTSDFKDFIVPSSVWKAIFFLSSIICFIWLIHDGCKSFKNRKKYSVDSIIADIVSESQKLTS